MARSSTHTTERPRQILPIIVAAQFAGTSLWFAGNAVLPQLSRALGVESSISAVTSSVQLGFIAGTAALTVSGFGDRFPARAVFFSSALAGAGFNLAMLWAQSPTVIALLRFAVGVSLAGIYPVGMKAAASWYRTGLGGALGFLVGALVLGTALPHLIGSALPWRATVLAVSLLAAAGGVAFLIWIPDGPYTRRSPFRVRDLRQVIRDRVFLKTALGYFGHMWELYTVWAFLPVLIATHGHLPGPITSFATIGVGAIGCAGGGLLASRLGSRRVAQWQLLASGACCLLVPFALEAPSWVFLCYLLVWGITVVGDSPQLSALTAQAAPPALVGTGLALVTSVGFALTVVSIELASVLDDVRVALSALAVGPAIGWLALRGLDSPSSD